MPTSNTDYRDRYQGNSTTGPFPATFDVRFDSSGNAKDLRVYYSLRGAAPVDITSLCTISGRNVTVDQGYSPNYEIIIEREPEAKQVSEYDFEDTFPGDQFQEDLDFIYFHAQRIRGERDRSLKQGFTDTSVLNDLPGKDERANSTLAFNAEASPIAAMGVVEDGVPVGSAVKTLLDDMFDPTAQETLGVWPKSQQYTQAELDGGQLDSRYYTEDETNEKLLQPVWGAAVQVGGDLNIAGVVANALASLSDSEVAFIADNIGEIQKYQFDGNAFSTVGSGLSLGTVGRAALTALNSTDVAFVDTSGLELRTYRFSGSAWSLVGSGLAVPDHNASDITALTQTDIAFSSDQTDDIRLYRFGGSTWSLIDSLSITGVGRPALAALNATDVAFMDTDNEELRVYRFAGSAWSQIGTPFTLPAIASGNTATMSALNETDVAFMDSANLNLEVYRFDGSTWTLVSARTNLTGAGRATISALTGTDIAFFDNTNEDLRVYRFGWTLSEPYRPF